MQRLRDNLVFNSLCINFISISLGIPLRDIPDVNRLVAHLDHSNPHTFEVDDLSKLIKQVCMSDIQLSFLKPNLHAYNLCL